MYCEFCGKELKKGEICQCQMGNQPLKAARKVNGWAILSYVFAAAGIVAFFWLKFAGASFYETWDFLKKIQIYLTSGIAVLFGILGIIAAVKAMKRKVMRKLSLAALLVNLILCLGTAVWGAVDHMQLANLKKTISQSAEDMNSEEIKSIYAEDPDSSVSREIVSSLRSEILKCVKSYKEEELSYEEVMEKLKGVEALQISELSEDIRKAQEEIEMLQQSAEAYQEGQSLAEAQKYGDAYVKLGQVKEKSPYYQAAAEALATIEKTVVSDTKEQAEKLRGKGNYQEAIKKVEDGLQILPKDEEMAALKKSLETEYIDGVLASADQMLEEHRYQDAIQLLTEAQQIDDSQKVRDKLALLDKYEAMEMTSLAVIDGYEYCVTEKEDVMMDAFGDSYGNAVELSLGQWDSASASYIYINADSRFSTLSGVITPGKDMAMEAGTDQLNTMQIEIYADDQLVYTSPGVSKITPAFTFEAPINYAKVVRIKLIRLVEKRRYIEVIIGNTKVYNE